MATKKLQLSCSLRCGINADNPIYNLQFLEGWPILFCLFSHFERDNQRITQDGANLNAGQCVVQRKLAFSRQFIRGSVGTPEGSQSLRAAIGPSSSDVRLRHYGSI